MSTRRFGPWLLVALFALVGCGGLRKVDIQGSVIYQGQPVQRGDIRFIPIEGTAGPVTGSEIVDGAYACAAPNGVPVGKHRVRITAYKTIAPKTKVPTPTLEDEGGSLQYLPDKYNTKSELELVIPGDAASITRDFNLDRLPNLTFRGVPCLDTEAANSRDVP